jgi:hypothetical protein
VLFFASRLVTVVDTSAAEILTMDSDLDHRAPIFDEIDTECARIGFRMRDLGGLALRGKDPFTAFLNLLREIPSGVGLEGFLERMRSYDVNFLTASEEVRKLESEDRARTTTCSFCGRPGSRERMLVYGPHGVAICSECVRLANDILE